MFGARGSLFLIREFINLHGDRLNVVTLSQRTVNDMTGWSEVVRGSRAGEQAFRTCKKKLMVLLMVLLMTLYLVIHVHICVYNYEDPLPITDICSLTLVMEI